MMLYALLKTLHLLTVVLWIGGMLFAHFFLRPSLAVLDPPQRLKLMREVLRRFFAAVLVASLLALESGLGMIHLASSATSGSGARFAWPIDWIAMTALGVLMLAIFGHIRFVLYTRFASALDAGDAPVAAVALAGIRAWVGTNLAIGLAMIALVLLV
jgi:uncharacterized membrane protein